MTETRYAARPGLTMAAALLIMLGPFSIDAYLPAFPAIEADYAVSRAALSQSLAGYLFAYASGMLVWGPLADHYGRRAIIVFSLLAFALSSAACAFAPGLDSFLVGRILQGLAASGSTVASRAMIRDAHTPQGAQRAMSQVMMVFTLAPVLAPLIGGALVSHLGWRSIFVALAMYSTILAAGMALWLPETRPQTAIRPLAFSKIFATYQHALDHKLFRVLLTTGTCTFGAFFLYIAGAPTVVFDVLKLDATDFIWQFGPMVAGMFTGSLVSAHIARQYGAVTAVHWAWRLALIAALLNLAQSLWLAPHILTVIAPLVIMAFAVALLLPGITVQLLDCFPHDRGAAAAVQGFAQMGFNAISASLILPALGASITAFAWTQLALLACAGWSWRRRLKML